MVADDDNLRHAILYKILLASKCVDKCLCKSLPLYLEWKFSQVFPESTAGEEVQEGTKQIIDSSFHGRCFFSSIVEQRFEFLCYKL